MNIAEEAKNRFPTNTGNWDWDQANKDLRQAFVSGAEWARKEALLEAASIAGTLMVGPRHASWDTIADEIRRLLEEN